MDYCTQPDVPEIDNRRPDMLRLLKGLDAFDLAGRSGLPTNYHFVLDGDTGFVHACGTWWHVVYNGGEIMVEPVNDATSLAVGKPQAAVAVPTTSNRRALSAATVAMRIAFVMRGEPIPLSIELTDEQVWTETPPKAAP